MTIFVLSVIRAMVPPCWMLWKYPHIYLSSDDWLIKPLAAGSFLLTMGWFSLTCRYFQSQVELLKNVRLRMVVILFLSSPGMTRQLIYNYHMGLFDEIGIKDRGDVLRLDQVDPRLNHQRTQATKDLVSLEKLLRCCHLRLPCAQQLKTQTQEWLRDNGKTSRPSTFLENVAHLQFYTVDPSTYCAVRSWTMLDLAVERVRAQHAIGLCAIIVLSALADIWWNVHRWDSFTCETWVALMRAGVFTFYLWQLCNSAVQLNFTMRSMSVSMIRDWKRRVQRVFVGSRNVELEVREVQDNEPPVFLSDVRVQLDNYLRGVMESLDHVIDWIEGREMPLSFFGLALDQALRTKLIAMFCGAVVGCLWNMFSGQIAEVATSTDILHRES